MVGDAVAIAAVARGADIVEKHFTLDKEMEGPDHVLSLLPAELREMVDRFDIVTTALGDGVKQPAANEVASIIRFRKTMYAAREIAVGEEISAQDVYYTGPAYGIYAKFEAWLWVLVPRSYRKGFADHMGCVRFGWRGRA